MRKILSFLLLFAAGLFVLWRIEIRRTNGQVTAPITHRTSTSIPRAAPSQAGMLLGGKSRFVMYHDKPAGRGRERVRRAFLRMSSQETRTEGLIDAFEDAQLQLFDPTSAEEIKQADLVAAVAHLTRQETGGNREMSYVNRALLRDLKATFLRDVFLAPLVFEAPEAVLDAIDSEKRRIESNDPFTIVSPRLDAGGRGIVYHLDDDLLEIREQGWLVFHSTADEDGDQHLPPSARFSSEERGALQVRAVPGSEPRAFIIKGWEGTRLNVSGERPALLTAKETTLGASAREAGGALTLDDLEANEDVHIELGDIIFGGNTASIRFDSEGSPSQATLRGLPRAVFPLPVTEGARALSPGATNLEDLRVEVSGVDTLNVRWEDGYHITLVGPSTLDTAGLSLRAAQGLTGYRSADELTTRFDITGGVFLETDQGTLETADLNIVLTTDAKGDVVFRGRASNGARIVGTLEDGRAFSATTPDTMTLVGSTSGWIVEEGTRVEVTVADPEGFFASADHVENIDLENFSLSARGNVHYRTNAADRRYRLDADALRIASEKEVLSPGETLARYVVEAEGKVNATVGSRGRSDTIACEKLLAIHTEARGAKPTESTSSFYASGGAETTATFRDGKLFLKADEATLERRLRGAEILEESLTAEGNVEFEGDERGFPFKGAGDRLVLNRDLTGRLIAHRGRVSLESTKADQMPFKMTADEVTFSETEIHAREPSISIADCRVRARRLDGTLEDWIELNGEVRASGFTPRNVPWTLTADKMRIEGRTIESQVPDEADIRGIYAYENVLFQLEGILTAEGDAFEWKKIHGTMRLEGTPVRAFSTVAHMETEWIEFDPELQMITGTGSTKVTPVAPIPPPKKEPTVPTAVQQISYMTSQEETPTAQETGTVLEFLSSSTQVDVELDSLVFLIQEPVFYSPASDTTLRASWAVFWIDRKRWIEIQDDMRSGSGGIVEGLRRSFDSLAGQAKARGPLSKLIDGFRAGPLTGLLREVYFEGPVEFIEGGDLLFRANAVYLDAVLGHGWLADATLNVYGRIVGESFEKLIVKADWLRHSEDGSLRADDATVTSCTFDDPHLKVVTGDLRIIPAGDSETGGQNRALFRLIMKNNRIELYDTLRIPLPTIDLKTDEQFRPLWTTLSLANSARFGTLLSLGASLPAGKTGELANELLTGAKEKPYRASFEIEGSYLGSRGGLLDLGMELASKENYFFDIYAGLVYDRDEDRGFIQVPEQDRAQLRYWLRSFGHFERGDSTLSLTLSHLSDAAVQSEFYEDEFLGYERDESYVQWHRSKGEWFSQISLKLRVDDFRSEIEELPSASAFHSRTPLFQVGKQPIIWVGNARAEYLRRLEAKGASPDISSTGTPNTFNPLTSPFGLPPRYADNLGEREVLRVDTTQTLEAPFSLNAAGLRMTPFVSARGTLWNEGVDPDQTPARGIAEVGARLSTTLWRQNSDGTRHQIVPYLGVRSEVARADDDVPVTFDEIEQVLTGDLFEAGARGRFGVHEDRSFIDMDLRATYASDRSDGAPDGWLPLGAYTRIDVSPWGRRFELWYDARYDIDDDQTDYSLISIGTRFGERFGLQAGHQRGRAVAGEALFEAATIEGIFRWTEKWEFEARQAFSLLDDQRLDLRVLVRRYGHDIVLDLETSVREGEGTSFGVSLRPRFGYRRPRIGYVPW